MIEPRLGPVHRRRRSAPTTARGRRGPGESQGPALRRCSRSSAFAILVLVLTLPAGRPAARPGDRRHHRHDAVHGQPAVHHRDDLPGRRASPTGKGAGTFKSANDVIAAVTKTFAGLGGLVFMLLMISQFIAYFNFSNLPSVLAIALADWLEAAGIGALPLLIGMIVVITAASTSSSRGSSPSGRSSRRSSSPCSCSSACRPRRSSPPTASRDSPLNTITPLMVYLPFMVTVAQRYRPEAGIGTIIALMLPYAVIVAVVWILLFVALVRARDAARYRATRSSSSGAGRPPTHERHRDRLRDPRDRRRPVHLRPGAGGAGGDRRRARRCGRPGSCRSRRRCRGSATRPSCSSRACSWSARAWTRPASRRGPGRSSSPGPGRAGGGSSCSRCCWSRP